MTIAAAGFVTLTSTNVSLASQILVMPAQRITNVVHFAKEVFASMSVVISTAHVIVMVTVAGWGITPSIAIR